MSQSLQVVCFSLRRLPYSSTSLSLYDRTTISNLSLYTHHIHMFCYTTELSLSSHTSLFFILPPLKSNTDPRPHSRKWPILINSGVLHRGRARSPRLVGRPAPFSRCNKSRITHHKVVYQLQCSP